MLEKFKERLKHYDEEHASDLSYYKKKQIALYFYHNYRVLQLIMFIVSLIVISAILKSYSNVQMPSDVRFFVIIFVLLLNTIISLKFIFKILKVVFTQSKTGYLTVFESGKSKGK